MTPVPAERLLVVGQDDQLVRRTASALGVL